MRVTADYFECFDNMPREYQEYISEHLTYRREINKAVADHKPRWMFWDGEWVQVVLVSRTQYNGQAGIMYRYHDSGKYSDIPLFAAAESSIDILPLGESPPSVVPKRLDEYCPDCDTILEYRAMLDGLDAWCPVCNMRGNN